MKDWWDMLRHEKYPYPYRIQWSPTGEVRAKHNIDPCWKTASCSKAEYAESIGYSLLKEVRYAVSKL